MKWWKLSYPIDRALNVGNNLGKQLVNTGQIKDPYPSFQQRLWKCLWQTPMHRQKQVCALHCSCNDKIGDINVHQEENG